MCNMQGLIAMLAAVDALSHLDGLDELKKQVSLRGIKFQNFKFWDIPHPKKNPNTPSPPACAVSS